MNPNAKHRNARPRAELLAGAGVGRMTAPTVTGAVADVVAEHAATLTRLADALRTHEPSNVLPPHRILALSARVLNQLADVEADVVRLVAWLEPARGSSA